MRRLAKPLLLGAGLALALTACSGAEPVDPAAIAQWRVGLEADAEGASTLFAVVGPDSELDPDEDAMRIDFGSPLAVESVEFSCFGEGGMRARMTGISSTGTTIHDLDAFDCSDSPHAIDAELLGETPLEAFGFTGHSVTEHSAWFVTVREG
jgi:hypothetical protein